jgi:hypothetical protein
LTEKQKQQKGHWKYGVMAILFAFTSIGVYFLSVGQGLNTPTCIGITLLISGVLFALLFAVWSVDWGVEEA